MNDLFDGSRWLYDKLMELEMPKKTVSVETEEDKIEIPMSLAKLLTATVDDYKDPDRYEETQNVAKAMLRLLMEH